VVSFGCPVYGFVMCQNFLPDTVYQTLLFPPSLHAWLPDAHLARFLMDFVSVLDLDAIYASYREKDVIARVLQMSRRKLACSGGSGSANLNCLAPKPFLPDQQKENVSRFRLSI